MGICGIVFLDTTPESERRVIFSGMNLALEGNTLKSERVGTYLINGTAFSFPNSLI